MRLDPVAIPCRACLAPPGRYCFVLVLGGPADDSMLPDCHDERRADAATVGKILAAGYAAEAPITAACSETWVELPSRACCMHGYIWECPSVRPVRDGGGEAVARVGTRKRP